MPDISEISRVLTDAREEFLGKANVVATGIGFKNKEKGGELSIVCSVTNKVEAAKLSSRDMVPKTVDGIITDVVATGTIRALNVYTQRRRPAPGGVSIGHRDITAGTLGCLVKKDGEWLILSNNHVMANSNDANKGDAILQPGPIDGGRYPDDQIGVLEDFIPLRYQSESSDCNIANGAAAVLNGVARLLGSRARLQSVSTQATDNLVDCAIARPISVDLVQDEILDIGSIAGVGQAELGMPVQKTGRTTGHTRDIIQQVDVTVNVQYGGNRVARFSDQLLAGPMSQGGDSGSAVLDDDKRLVGLLFAGSEQSTIINRIEHVFSALNITRS